MTTQAAIQDPVRFLELYRKIEKNKSVEFFQHMGKPLLHIVKGRGGDLMGRSTIQIGDEVRYWDELTPKERHDIWEVMAKRIGKTIEEYVLANPDQYERVKAGLEWAAEHPWGKPKQEDNTAKSE